jgi:hypothetical protein
VAATVPTSEPTEHQAGNSLAWTKTLSDYPASAWTLTYYIPPSNAGQAPISITATPDGDDFSIAVTAADTTAWEAGSYWLAGYVSNTTERYQVYFGPLTITANIAGMETGNAFDGRTQSQRLLAKAIAAYEDALRAVAEYGFNGVHSKLQLEALSKEIDRLTDKVTQEQSTGRNRKILARFRSPR